MDTSILARVRELTGKDAYFVGGCVRDHFLNRESTDLDVMVIGDDASISDLTSRGWIPTGKSFPNFNHPELPNVDLALARGETKTGRGHTEFSYHLAQSVPEDLSRRDFTVNAMAVAESGMLFDPFNGIVDLNAKKLRHVSDAFSEDPLRVFRGARFAAQLNFDIDTQTILKMRSLGEELLTLSKDRVREEFLKGLNSDHPTKFFIALWHADVLQFWFPELDKLQFVPAGKEIHHPEGDTFSHTMLALQYCADKKFNTLTRIFALCHDLGKADTPREEWPAHHGHEARTEAADTMLGRLGFNEGMRRQTATHIRHHLLPNQPRLRPTTVVNYWKATKRMRDEHFGAYHADINGHGAKEHKESPRVAQLRDIFTDLDNVEVVPSKNVQSIHQQFQRAAATSMAKKPSVESNWK